MPRVVSTLYEWARVNPTSYDRSNKLDVRSSQPGSDVLSANMLGVNVAHVACNLSGDANRGCNLARVAE